MKNVLRHFMNKWALVVLVALVPSIVWAQSSVLNNVGAGAVTQKKFGFMSNITHYPRLRNDQEDTTDILARGEYFIDGKNRIRVDQFFTKYYSTYPGEHEFRPADTSVRWLHNSDWKPYGMFVQPRLSVTLPISDYSNKNDAITRVTASALILKGFKKLGITVLGFPYATYHWNEFKQSKSGDLMPWYTFGGSLLGIYSFTDSLSLTASMGYSFQGLRPSQFETNKQQLNNGTYSFGLDVTYQFNNTISGSLGYDQGNDYMQNGRYEVALFDSQNTRYYLGMMLQF